MYAAYKPFRNFLRTLPVSQSLELIWGFMQHLERGSPPLPAGPGWMHLKIHRSVYPWDLALLAREILQHSPASGSASLRNYQHFAKAINFIRAIDDRVSGLAVNRAKPLEHIHRSTQAQFPWQARHDEALLLRYLKIFGEARIEAAVKANTGLTLRELYFLGIAVSGALLSEPGVNANTDYTMLGIDRDRSRRFFEAISADLNVLRLQLDSQKSYDASWAYAWNPLEKTPLVRVDPRRPEMLHCPVPLFLMRRISYGVYYDVYNDANFDNAYGSSFEKYVGDVLQDVLGELPFTITKPEPYFVKGQRKDGADWLLTDTEANVFIECKTKRLSLSGKLALEDGALEQQIAHLATAVVQLYKNVSDAMTGLTEWKPNGRPIYPLVVTLEDWYLFSPATHSLLESAVADKIQAAGLPKNVLTEMPYTIASCQDFEHAIQAIAATGLSSFFAKKTDDEHRRWMVRAFIPEVFGNLPPGTYRRLFAGKRVASAVLTSAAVMLA